MLSIFLITVLYLVLNCRADVSFAFKPGQPKVFTGFIWRGAKNVYLGPKLQAIPDGKNSKSKTLCDIKVYTSQGELAPFYVNIIDESDGFADLYFDKNIEKEFKFGSSYIFYLEAKDCDSPPHISSRVPINIHFLDHEGPFFTQRSYSFTMGQLNHVGQVVGQVQAIRQIREDENGMFSVICGYQLSPNDVPFDIDGYGNIRVQEKLPDRPSGKPYMFQVVVEDCHRPTPRRTAVDVMIQQLTHGCQAGWKALPIYLESRGSSGRAENLFHSYKPQLELCGRTCVAPEITVRLELQSAVSGYQLQTASTAACLHDPEYLERQRQLCDINPVTLTNLLPNPNDYVTAQLVGPPLGNPPSLRQPTQSWKFDASLHTVWQVDPVHLSVETNAFDADFTVAFWIRRFYNSQTAENVNFEDREETVICSQDKVESKWRFASVSFSECNVIVRLLASLKNVPIHDNSEARRPAMWTFGPLPTEYCTWSNEEPVGWHHYAITFAHDPWGASTEMVSLLIDGQNLDNLSVPNEAVFAPVPPYRPSERKARPQITVGACFDPTSRLTKQHLNAELAGLTVLLDKTEAPNKLRCLAQCGESLLVPKVLKLLHDKMSVNLDSNAVTVTSPSVSHVVDLLQAVAYVRPQPGVSEDYTPHAVQARKLMLTTTYRCSEPVQIAPFEMKLNVFPEKENSVFKVEMARPFDNMAGSSWAQQDMLWLDRPPIAQADMERKALRASTKANLLDAPPSLLIEGADILTTEPPILVPGLPIFSDIRFVLPERDGNRDSHIAAAAVPLESCIVWIDSSGTPSSPDPAPGLREFEEERIDWSTELVVSFGLSGVNDKHGVKLRGSRPAGDYEQVLRTLHYWPPKFVQSAHNPVEGTKLLNGSKQQNVKYFARIGLLCSGEAGKHTTSSFFVDIFIQSQVLDTKSGSMKDTIQSKIFDEESSESVMPNHVQSHGERRKLIADPRPVAQAAAPPPPPGPKPLTKPSSNNLYLTIGLVAAVVLVIASISLILVMYVRIQSRLKTTKTGPHSGRRKRFPAKPADFGGSSLRHDPTLRLTANPMGQVVYSGIGTVSEDLYGSNRNLTQSPHIFSPPSSRLGHRRPCPMSGPKLAGLDEFDENFLAHTWLEDHDESKECDALGSRQLHGSENEQSNMCHSSSYEADVHEWIDEEGCEDCENAECIPLKRLDTCDLVTESKPSDCGSTVVNV